MNNSNNIRNGFTLVEMIVVISIIAVLAILSVPYFGGFANRTKLDSSCRDLVSYANYARSQAVLKGVRYRLTFDFDQQAYTLTYENSSSDMAGQYSPADGKWGDVVNIDSSIRMTSIQLDQNPLQDSGVAIIVFNPQGTTNDVLVNFQDYNQDIRKVSLTGITGLAQIQSNDTTT